MVYKLYVVRTRLNSLKGVIHKHSKYTSAAIPSTHTESRGSHSVFHKVKVSLLPSQRCIHMPSCLYMPNIVHFMLSDIGEGIVEVIVKEWFVKPGDHVAQFDPICEVQSDKASVTISSRYDGIVKKLHYDVDEVAKVGSPLLDILSEDGDRNTVPIESPKQNQQDIDNDVYSNKNKPLATPAVRRIAKENSIKLNEVKGSGRAGRVLKEDVLSYVDSSKPKKNEPLIKTMPAPTSAATLSVGNTDKKVEIAGFRKAMAKSMSSAWLVPHFLYCDEVDVTEIVNIKPELQRLGNSKNVKITFMPLFIKAASLALTKYPVLNSTVDANCEYLTVKSCHNIGVAMDTPNGLVVPNVKNVHKLDVLEIAKELNRLQDLGAKGQLGMTDLKDGTFTLSNIGSIGGTYAKPIIFTPQVAIGAFGKIQVLPRFDESKNIKESHIFNVSWSADHRVIDGATLTRFSNLWKLYLESPRLLLNL